MKRSELPPRRNPLARSTKRIPQRRRLDEAERLRRAAVREEVGRRDRICVLNAGTANRRYYEAARAAGVEHRCFGDRETMHHLKKASGGGEYTPDNLVLLCAHGNTWVEDNPKLANEAGLVLR